MGRYHSIVDKGGFETGYAAKKSSRRQTTTKRELESCADNIYVKYIRVMHHRLKEESSLLKHLQTAERFKD